MRVLLAVAIACCALVRPAAAQAPGPILTTLDSAGDVGRDSDVEYGPTGRATISYLDATNGALKVALCENVACTSAVLRTLDSSGTVGGSTSIAFGADGRALVAYQDAAARSVKVARCADAACTTASLATVESLAQLGPGTAIGVGGDGLPVVLYPDPANGQVRIAHCADADCTSAAITAYPGVGRVGLTIGGDGLALFTAEVPPNVLVRHCSDAACSTATTGFFVPGPGSFSDASIATDFNGFGVVAIVRDGVGVTRWGCTDAACNFLALSIGGGASGVHPAVVRSAAAPNGALQMVFAGLPGSEHLKTRTCPAPPDACYNRWIDAAGAGRHPAATVGPEGYTLVSYEDGAAGDLKVAYLTGFPPGALALAPSVVEGNSGTTPAVLEVRLSHPGYGKLSFSTTSTGTATAGTDYVATGGSLTFSPETPVHEIAVPVIGDALPEGDENFFVLLSNGDGVGGLWAGSGDFVTIVDDENGAPSGLTVGNASVVEGDAGPTVAVFSVHLDPPTAGAVTAPYFTQGWTAASDTDFLPVSGTLTFAPGETAKTVEVQVLGDVEHEADEMFVLKISSPSGAYAADGTGVGTIVDDEALVSVADASVVEGDSGTAALSFTVSLDAPALKALQVDFATTDGTATAGVDYAALSGTLTFAPGQAAQSVSVAVTGDLDVEPDETLQLALSNPSGGVILLDNVSTGLIANDDAPESPILAELRHGASYTGDLAAQGGPTADLDEFRIAQEPFASYEVLVDAASGDAVPLALERRDAGTTVVQSGTPVGTGTARSLRWRAAGTAAVDDQTIRVAGACGTSCGADDVYRVRAWETTLRAARFNNSGAQTTLLVLHNPGDTPILLDVRFWAPDGTLLATHTPAGPLASRGVVLLNTAGIVAGASGSLTVAHDGPYGGLVGKAVSLEPATGLSFDTPLEPRPR